MLRQSRACQACKKCDFILAGRKGIVLIQPSRNTTPDNPSNNYIKKLMAKSKPLTKSQIAAAIAEATQITKKTAAEILDFLAKLAYANAKKTFTLPGIGKLVLVDRKARIGRNPATGAEIKIPAKKVVKFRVAKAAKDAILGTK